MKELNEMHKPKQNYTIEILIIYSLMIEQKWM